MDRRKFIYSFLSAIWGISPKSEFIQTPLRLPRRYRHNVTRMLKLPCPCTRLKCSRQRVCPARDNERKILLSTLFKNHWKIPNFSVFPFMNGASFCLPAWQFDKLSLDSFRAIPLMFSIVLFSIQRQKIRSKMVLDNYWKELLCHIEKVLAFFR